MPDSPSQPSPPEPESAPRFTPGPWEIFGGAVWQVDGTEVPAGTAGGALVRLLGPWPGRFIAFFDGDKMLASVLEDPDIWRDEERPTLEGDARLIAAAPDLYQALATLVGYADWPPREPMADVVVADSAIRKARAALAKVRGERQ